jgi:hypothetical protein
MGDSIILNLKAKGKDGNITELKMDKETWVNAVLEKLSQAEFPSYLNKTGKEIVAELINPKVHVGAERTKGKPTLGQSKVGGKPHVEKGFEWPCEEDDADMPMQFILQLNLSEIREVDFDQKLPATGMLWFFTATDGDYAYSNGFDETTTKVIYSANPGELKAHKMPEALKENEDAFIKEQPLVFGPTITFDDDFDSSILDELDAALQTLGGKYGPIDMCYNHIETYDEDIQWVDGPPEEEPVYMLCSIDGYSVVRNIFGEGTMKFVLSYPNLETGSLEKADVIFNMGT